MIRFETERRYLYLIIQLLRAAVTVALVSLAMPVRASDPAFPTADQIAAAARAMGRSDNQANTQDIRFCPGDPADVERLKGPVRCYVARHSASDGLYHVIASYDRPSQAGDPSIVDGMVRIGRWLYETVAGNSSSVAATVDPSALIDDAVGKAVRQSEASMTAAAQVNRGTAAATREATELFGQVAQSAVKSTEMTAPLGLDLIPSPSIPPSYPRPSNFPPSYAPPRSVPSAKATPAKAPCNRNDDGIRGNCAY